MKRYHYVAVLGVLLVLMGLVLWVPALAQETEGASVPAQPEVLQGFYDDWVHSGHADITAEAFNHWNEDEEKVVPETCARCHSTPGYRDYLGVDGSAYLSVEEPAPLGTTITCDACHNEVTWTLTEVTFPSGAMVDGLGDASRCMVCHQGRESGVSVSNAIAEAGVTDMNEVSENLRFINIHYYAAAASLYGSEAHGGYEFEGKNYQMRGDHVEGYDTCISCHDPHTLEVKVDECTACHDVSDEDDFENIRMNGSLKDYDGDGNTREGIAEEIETLQEMLYTAIQRYAAEVIGTPIVYDSHSYPYFFEDADGNGEVSEGDGRYSTFSGLLLQTTYNFQVTMKDPGGFAHNPKYHIELLYDSIEMLNAQISEPVDLSMAHRNDAGHFDSTAEPFRHWDEEGEVNAPCSRCHTAEGLPFLVEYGAVITQEPSNSLACTTCHDQLGEFTLYTVDEVTFPSGATVSFGEAEASNLCITCHQGRESTVSVNSQISRAGVGDDEVSESLRFANIHYFAAGATLFGSEVQGAYQFDGMDYNGRNMHTRRFDECVDCHNEHELGNRIDECTECHEEVTSQADVRLIRLEDEDVEAIDYDGDGDATEPIADEIATLHDALLTVIMDYSTNVIGATAVYNSHAYPYWFEDTNASGDADADDARYGTWTPALLRAAYNYQYVAKDPGAFAHNPDYILQVLYDSLQSLGGDEAVANYTRPPVKMGE